MMRKNIVFVFLCLVIIVGVVIFVSMQDGEVVPNSDIPRIVTEEEKANVLELLETKAVPSSSTSPSDIDKRALLNSLSNPSVSTSSTSTRESSISPTDEEKEAILKSLEKR